MSARAATSVIGPSGPSTSLTARRFAVSVPVLSVTMRSTAPRVSSADSRRTRTPRRSRRYAPSPRITARRTGGSSGMAAIAAEIPARTFAPSGLPRRNPAPTVMTIRPIATTRRMRTSRRARAGGAIAGARCRRGRARSARTRSWSPSRSRCLRPDRRRQQCRRRRSSGGPRRRRPIGSGSVDASSGTDSPVRALRSTSSRSATVKRISAGTISPPRRRTTSPGTSSAAPMSSV